MIGSLISYRPRQWLWIALGLYLDLRHKLMLSLCACIQNTVYYIAHCFLANMYSILEIENLLKITSKYLLVGHNSRDWSNEANAAQYSPTTNDWNSQVSTSKIQGSRWRFHLQASCLPLHSSMWLLWYKDMESLICDILQLLTIKENSWMSKAFQIMGPMPIRSNWKLYFAICMH